LTRNLVSRGIPLKKAWITKTSYFPQGSIILIRPASPTNPFEFLFDCTPTLYNPVMSNDGYQYKGLESVQRIFGLPCVFGLRGDERLVDRAMHVAIPWDAIDNPSLMDGGANICITGVLDLLVDVVTVLPLPILLLFLQAHFLKKIVAPNKI
jgi:hypothetical protein